MYCMFCSVYTWSCECVYTHGRASVFMICVVQDDRAAMLSYSFKVSLSLIQNRKFRRTVHESLVKLYNELGVPDLISICQVSSKLVSSLMTDVKFCKQELNVHVLYRRCVSVNCNMRIHTENECSQYVDP